MQTHRSWTQVAQSIVGALAFALRFQGRKRVHHADNMMAQITAERLVEHLQRSGFVVMKKPPAPIPRRSRKTLH